MPIDYLDNYRDPLQVATLARGIAAAADDLKRPIRLMEVCGGHTMAMHRFGIPSLMPAGVELVSGPGCPVCVTPVSYIDAAISWAETSGGMITTFGDLYRVAGSRESLENAALRGLDVRVVYSPMGALDTARELPGREVLFLAVGFETTAPAVAATLGMAENNPDAGFRIMSGHKTMPPALRTLVDADDVAVDGLILPGHVSTIIGAEPYRFLAEDHHVACCITGFEPLDIMQGILSLIKQCVHEAPLIENRYRRAVRREGNQKALQLMHETFDEVDSRWRGLGCIERSGLELKSRWANCVVPGPDPHEDAGGGGTGCRCGEILRGVLLPSECPLFAGVCTPETPAGACMISSEGACAAAYRYRSV